MILNIKLSSIIKWCYYCLIAIFSALFILKSFRVSLVFNFINVNLFEGNDEEEKRECGREPINPKPPPRYKRKVKMQGVQNLNLENLSNDEDHQNDILFNVYKSQHTAGDIVKGFNFES